MIMKSAKVKQKKSVTDLSNWPKTEDNTMIDFEIYLLENPFKNDCQLKPMMMMMICLWLYIQNDHYSNRHNRRQKCLDKLTTKLETKKQTNTKEKIS